MQKRPYVLTIAGYDPSGGAGVLADVKTFEAYKTIGLAVSTAITYQSEEAFLGIEWLPENYILKQLEPLLAKYTIKFVKIGLIENMDRLSKIVALLKQKDPKIKIIWDPVLKASAGYSFHNNLNIQKLEKTASGIFLITPNIPEIKSLYPEITPQNGATHLSSFCNVLLKGGHDKDNLGKDLLLYQDKVSTYKPKQISTYTKHGTGCILSAAITAGLTKGFPLHKAVLKAKQYVTNVLLSNKSRLGYHKI